VAESLIGNYREFFRTVVFRFFFVYGPGQERMLVPTLFDRVRRGEEVTVHGRPGTRINPIHVDDAVRVFEPALRLERSELFNVAGDETVAIEELVELMGRVAGRTVRIEHGPRVHDGDMVGDNARMKEVLGVRPEIRLDRGLGSML
jgi:nucleoside-diphosphate-sugar epimerase